MQITLTGYENLVNVHFVDNGDGQMTDNTKAVLKGKLTQSAKTFLIYNELRDQGVPKKMAVSFARRLVANPKLMDEIEAARKVA